MVERRNKVNNPKLSSMRVYITERCNAHCPNCFNSKTRLNVEMPVDSFKKLCEYLSLNGVECLKILGGEPTVHNCFENIIEIAQEYFPEIAIFSNGIDDKIGNLKLRDKDTVIYNFLFNKELSEKKFHFENGGSRSLEIQVHKDSDEKVLASRIIDIVNINREKIHVALTLDCTSNIFKEKGILIPKLKYLEKTLNEKNIHFSYDHKMPLCYLYNTDLHPNNTSSCSVETAGVIDSSLNLRFCLQNPDLLVNIYQDEKFIPWQVLINHLYKKYYELRLVSLNKICLNCAFFNFKCNGGCWIPKENISRDDILKNTSFPTV